ncbi:UDP-N-acetylmuramoyl-L-alanine--D-glutamate ligase [Candidatus Saccharibacteria bacterium]|nr:UDP-N-acetylmuramoyl-L-alanine--D-glutamate ligase [Candidatus Saccharibacteria bacterium]
MKIALLGYGKEGQAVEKYFKDKAEIDIFENFDPVEIRNKDYSSYDMIFRSPSVPPLGLENETSVTKYFFDHCPCTIIGVTATKGKGTTCSFIKALLDASGADVYLVGNIGNPAIDVLDSLAKNSVVVYEMSSFQLWDLTKSPHIAVVGTIEPDHLNVHKDYDDYVGAKTNICRYQTEDDYLVYYDKNPESVKIAKNSPAKKISYPFDLPEDIKKAVKIPGEHNLNNAMAAIAAVASYKNISLDEYLKEYKDEIKKGLAEFKGLPHRLEFLRDLEGVKYYDDNFSTNLSSTRVAIESFPGDGIVLILGGRDKTDNEDLPEIHDYLKEAKNICRIILMGESGHELAKRYEDDPRYMVVESLEEAVNTANQEAFWLRNVSYVDNDIIVLMSPAAASFDMFKNVYDRGDQFKNLVESLK